MALHLWSEAIDAGNFSQQSSFFREQRRAPIEVTIIASPWHSCAGQFGKNQGTRLRAVSRELITQERNIVIPKVVEVLKVWVALSGARVLLPKLKTQSQSASTRH